MHKMLFIFISCVPSVEAPNWNFPARTLDMFIRFDLCAASGFFFRNHKNWAIWILDVTQKMWCQNVKKNDSNVLIRKLSHHCIYFFWLDINQWDFIRYDIKCKITFQHKTRCSWTYMNMMTSIWIKIQSLYAQISFRYINKILNGI